MIALTALYDRFARALAWLSGAIAAFVMAVTFTGVVMRYLLRNPLSGGFEMIEIGMGLMVFTALPLMVRLRGNISVTILTDRMPPRLRDLLTLFSDLVGAGLSGFMAWRVWLQGERLLTYREVTMELRIPKGLIAQGMAVMLAVTALAFLLCAYEAWRHRTPKTDSKIGQL
ncbi:TRAP transporter small permease [Sulfitobacter aestuarii]|uniref:TRAP transporter small permease protein n=1 Tax=Sulfitobacter aestuarii TaxID=2161676 RepID=A0ABW5U1F8_9RHOB